MERPRRTRSGSAAGRLLLAALAGLIVGVLVTSTDDSLPTSAAPTTTIPPTLVPDTTTSTTTTTLPDPVFVEVPDEVVPTDDVRRRAEAVAAAGFVAPSHCGTPLINPNHLPNAPRSYRTGVHQGVDFFCAEPGHDAVSSLPGRVVAATTSYEEPAVGERDALLEVAARLGRTPVSLLWMLWGRHVVVDHGVVDGVGHVVTVYAHLHDIDPALRPGTLVAAGQRIGEIGLSGTDAGAAGRDEPPEIHLHWELHVDDRYFGQGLGADDTVAAYRVLLG